MSDPSFRPSFSSSQNNATRQVHAEFVTSGRLSQDANQNTAYHSPFKQKSGAWPLHQQDYYMESSPSGIPPRSSYTPVQIHRRGQSHNTSPAYFDCPHSSSYRIKAEPISPSPPNIAHLSPLPRNAQHQTPTRTHMTRCSPVNQRSTTISPLALSLTPRSSHPNEIQPLDVSNHDIIQITPRPSHSAALSSLPSSNTPASLPPQIWHSNTLNSPDINSPLFDPYPLTTNSARTDYSRPIRTGDEVHITDDHGTATSQKTFIVQSVSHSHIRTDIGEVPRTCVVRALTKADAFVDVFVTKVRSRGNSQSIEQDQDGCGYVIERDVVEGERQYAVKMLDGTVRRHLDDNSIADFEQIWEKIDWDLVASSTPTTAMACSPDRGSSASPKSGETIV